MKHVCIVNGFHLWQAPRVIKEADALTRAGYRVTVVSPDTTEMGSGRDAPILASRSWKRIVAPDMLGRRGTGAKRFVLRATRRLQTAAVQRFGFQIADSLGYGIWDTVRTAASLKADFYCCHDEVGLVAFSRLWRMGHRCAVDLEDWYSQDLPPEVQRKRPIALLAGLEREALHKAEFVMTTSHVMADALTAAYGGQKPLVIYNAFEHARRATAPPPVRDRSSTKRTSLHWYSQTLGPYRGLEILFDAINRLEQDFELHLRGEAATSYKQALIDRLRPSVAKRVFFHPTVGPEELSPHIAEHDIGLALERGIPRNNDLTIANKIFQFLQCGCAVVATRTSGQEEAGRMFPQAITLTDLNPEALAEAIAALLDDPARLAKARAAARAAGAGPASWEHLSQPLLARYREALDRG